MIRQEPEVPTILTVLDWGLFLAQLTLIVHVLYELLEVLGPGYYAARAEELVLLLGIFCFLTATNICISLLSKSYLDEPRYRESEQSVEL